eukprot:jgi/Mesvir1/22361/Mv17863-RA.1
MAVLAASSSHRATAPQSKGDSPASPSKGDGPTFRPSAPENAPATSSPPGRPKASAGNHQTPPGGRPPHAPLGPSPEAKRSSARLLQLSQRGPLADLLLAFDTARAAGLLTRHCYTSLLRGLAIRARARAALTLLPSLAASGWEPHPGTLREMVVGCGAARDVAGAAASVATFRSLYGISLSPAGHTALLRACAAERDSISARVGLSRMKWEGVELDAERAGWAAIACLPRRGAEDPASDVLRFYSAIQEMRGRGWRPGESVYRAGLVDAAECGLGGVAVGLLGEFVADGGEPSREHFHLCLRALSLDGGATRSSAIYSSPEAVASRGKQVAGGVSGSVNGWYPIEGDGSNAGRGGGGGKAWTTGGMSLMSPSNSYPGGGSYGGRSGSALGSIDAINFSTVTAVSTGILSSIPGRHSGGGNNTIEAAASLSRGGLAVALPSRGGHAGRDGGSIGDASFSSSRGGRKRALRQALALVGDMAARGIVPTTVTVNLVLATALYAHDLRVMLALYDGMRGGSMLPMPERNSAWGGGVPQARDGVRENSVRGKSGDGGKSNNGTADVAAWEGWSGQYIPHDGTRGVAHSSTPHAHSDHHTGPRAWGAIRPDLDTFGLVAKGLARSFTFGHTDAGAGGGGGGFGAGGGFHDGHDGGGWFGPAALRAMPATAGDVGHDVTTISTGERHDGQPQPGSQSKPQPQLSWLEAALANQLRQESIDVLAEAERLLVDVRASYGQDFRPCPSLWLSFMRLFARHGMVNRVLSLWREVNADACTGRGRNGEAGDDGATSPVAITTHGRGRESSLDGEMGTLVDNGMGSPVAILPLSPLAAIHGEKGGAAEAGWEVGGGKGEGRGRGIPAAVAGVGSSCEPGHGKNGMGGNGDRGGWESWRERRHGEDGEGNEGSREPGKGAGSWLMAQLISPAHRAGVRIELADRWKMLGAVMLAYGTRGDLDAAFRVFRDAFPEGLRARLDAIEATTSSMSHAMEAWSSTRPGDTTPSMPHAGDPKHLDTSDHLRSSPSPCAGGTQAMSPMPGAGGSGDSSGPAPVDVSTLQHSFPVQGKSPHALLSPAPSGHEGPGRNPDPRPNHAQDARPREVVHSGPRDVGLRLGLGDMGRDGPPDPRRAFLSDMWQVYVTTLLGMCLRHERVARGTYLLLEMQRAGLTPNRVMLRVLAAATATTPGLRKHVLDEVRRLARHARYDPPRDVWRVLQGRWVDEAGGRGRGG